MSARDRKLVEAIGISKSELARRLKRARQTISRGIASDNDFFNEYNLSHMLGGWQNKDSVLFNVTRDKICELYPDIAEFVIESSLKKKESALSVQENADYWVVTGDFAAFKNNHEICWEQFCNICAAESKNINILIFINRRDLPVTRKALQKYLDRSAERIRPIPCGELDLSVLPTYVIRISHEGDVDMYGLSDAGFVTLSRNEAIKLRAYIADQEQIPESASETAQDHNAGL